MRVGGWVGVCMYVLCASLSNTHHASFENKYVGEGRVAHIAKIEREGEVKAHTHTHRATYIPAGARSEGVCKH